MDHAWEVFYGLGALLLGLALIWGIMRSRNRNRANDPVTAAATRAEYEDPANYGEKREELKKHVHPSP